MSDKNFEQHNEQPDHEQDTEFHYPAGKLDEELVEAPHGGWAADDFNEEEFDFEFDDSEYGEAHFIDEEKPAWPDKTLPKKNGRKLNAPSVSQALRTPQKTCARSLSLAVLTWASPRWSTAF